MFVNIDGRGGRVVIMDEFIQKNEGIGGDFENVLDFVVIIESLLGKLIDELTVDVVENAGEQLNLLIRITNQIHTHFTLPQVLGRQNHTQFLLEVPYTHLLIVVNFEVVNYVPILYVHIRVH